VETHGSVTKTKPNRMKKLIPAPFTVNAMGTDDQMGASPQRFLREEIDT
jgi:hypothetical protein